MKFSDPNGDFQIEIRSKPEKDGHRKGYDKLEIRSEFSCDASPGQIELAEALIEGRYLTKFGPIKTLPHKRDGNVIIDKFGIFLVGYSATLEMIPDDLKDLVIKAFCRKCES